MRTRAALEWDLFPIDDPRANRLAVSYHLGWAVARYNIRNVLGELFAQYPLTGIDAVGSVRHDGNAEGPHPPNGADDGEHAEFVELAKMRRPCDGGRETEMKDLARRAAPREESL